MAARNVEDRTNSHITNSHISTEEKPKTTQNNTNNNDDEPCESHDCVEIAKKVYVLIAILFGFGLAGLKTVSDPVDEWLDSMQEDAIYFLWEKPGWCIAIIFVVTLMKAVSMKDVLGIRTITVVILSWKITDKHEVETLCLAMFIMGILSSMSKLTEYKAIGKELQFVMGTPTKFIMKYIKLALIKCCKVKEERLIWFDTHYILEISYKSRNDKRMSILNNFQYRYGSGIDDDHPKTVRWVMHQCLVWIGAILWTSCVEWVQPITELFLFAHNWKMTPSNVLIIVLSEFADFDKMVETWYIIEGVKSGDIIGEKVKQLGLKGYFWLAGYTIILFPTLYWGYRYYQEVFTKVFPDDVKHMSDVELEEVDQQSQRTDRTETQDTVDELVVRYPPQSSTQL